MSDAAMPIKTTDDIFLGGRLDILQPREGHRAGLDAVLLAAAVQTEGRPVRVLDAGAGPSIVGLALAAREPGTDVTGLESEPALVALANENARRNGLADRVRVLCGDVTAPQASLEDQGLKRESFDIVVSNPPFHDAEASQASPLALRAGASRMPAGGLERWARFFAAMARPQGALYMIHRADQLRAILDALEGRFGGLRIQPLHPRAGDAAHRVIVHGRKGSRAPLQLRPGLVLHGADGKFGPEVERVLRGAEPLDW